MVHAVLPNLQGWNGMLEGHALRSDRAHETTGSH